jgi:hypothetical protein
MEHIRQTSTVGTDCYTVVVTTDWVLPLNEHPSIVEHPELFEISTDEIPTNFQYLNYI